MISTSHFIGIKIKSEILVNLYVKLQNAIQDDSTIIDFQNILSSHITLYYLPSILQNETEKNIQSNIITCNASLPF